MWKVQVCCGTNIYVIEKLKNRKVKGMEECTRAEMNIARNVPIEQYVNEKEQYKMKKVTQKSSTV